MLKSIFALTYPNGIVRYFATPYGAHAALKYWEALQDELRANGQPAHQGWPPSIEEHPLGA